MKQIAADELRDVIERIRREARGTIQDAAEALQTETDPEKIEVLKADLAFAEGQLSALLTVQCFANKGAGA